MDAFYDYDMTTRFWNQVGASPRARGSGAVNKILETKQGLDGETLYRYVNSDDPADSHRASWFSKINGRYSAEESWHRRYPASTFTLSASGFDLINKQDGVQERGYAAAYILHKWYGQPYPGDGTDYGLDIGRAAQVRQDINTALNSGPRCLT